MPEIGYYHLELTCDDHGERHHGKGMRVPFRATNVTRASEIARRQGWASYGINTPQSRKWRCPGCARAHAKNSMGGA